MVSSLTSCWGGVAVVVLGSLFVEAVAVEKLALGSVDTHGGLGTIIPCENASGMYSGVELVQGVSQALTLIPRPGTPYARFGVGHGNVSSGQHVSLVFEGTGNLSWSGQFLGGCAALFISGDGHHTANAMQLLRGDPGPKNWSSPSTPAPDWVKDLVIYEIAPRGFTSPNGTGPDGMGSGTFASMTLKVPYLQQLGVTAVWLAGYCDANAHFFSIWSVYATERPDSIDSALGEAADLTALVSALHAAGIKVFLDVVTHGVTFSAGEYANRSKLMANPFLTEQPDFFFHESYDPPGKASGKWLMADYNYASPAFIKWWQTVWLTYVAEFDVDGFRLDGPNGLSYSAEVMAVWDNITSAAATGGKPIAVFGEMERYHFSEHDVKPTSTDLAANFQPPSDPSQCYQSTMLSCHDGGFDQAPGNYYGVKGSRARLGYSAVFSWYIPVLFSGDEANLDPVYLPALKKGCYSGGPPGGWLYGSQIQWSQLEEPPKAAMLRDSTRMLQIRRNESDVIHANACTSHVLRIPASTPEVGGNPPPIWVPYARFIPHEKAIVVVANPSNTSTLHLTLNISVASMGFASTTTFQVADLFNASSPTVTVSAAALAAYAVAVPEDGIEQGGLRILKITPLAAK